MTNSTAISRSASLPIGTTSPAVKTPETSASAVVFLSIKPTVRVAIPDSKPLGVLVREFEADPQMSARLAAARRNLAAAVLQDEEKTLRALRLNAGLSQDQLAARMNTAQSHIAR